MHPLARYTQRAREFAFKRPAFTQVNIHINFWVISFTLLGSILYLYDKGISKLVPGLIEIEYWDLMGPVIFLAMLYGLITGLIRSLVIQRRLDKLSSIAKVGVETLVYFLSYVGIWQLGQILSEDIFTQRGFYQADENEFLEFQFFSSSAFLLYVFFNIILLNFILQINTKYGPGVLIPMLLGYYKNPEVEEKVFLFMDLKNSTGIAEKLGHIKYSELIRDCFNEANYVVMKYNAQVYQYVGDEMVLTWEKSSGIKEHRCLNFFIHFQYQLKSRELEFMDNYGVFPEFKAGIHVGEITAIEVGVIKRDIAYHGDTINSASRIQDLCNPLNNSLLFSKELKEELEKEGPIVGLEKVGEHKLKGKVVKLELYTLSQDMEMPPV